MFASVDSFLPDYDSSLYSLWNAPGGYDTENDAAQGQQQQEQVQPPLYMASEDELKMDYPQLPEFNQDLDSYLNDTMDSGGPSPTTPLGTSTGHNSSGMMKMDHLVTTDRRTGGSNLTMGTQLEVTCPSGTDLNFNFYCHGNSDSWVFEAGPWRGEHVRTVGEEILWGF
ncbi:WRKY transcription factor 19 [Phytophthora cinnamomi]|uniref:WRKY transcription factor 19 n=1 Tax=Phytophthora cinnamomi TaxID=4785 RepID=UPI003559DAB1|nr:WRKY transcription factor 19 [Phytophthora cinnamomi]